MEITSTGFACIILGAIVLSGVAYAIIDIYFSYRKK